jgi:hypothetical protein
MAESPTTSIFARDSMANPVIQPGRCRHQHQPQQEDDDEESSSSYSTIMLNHHVLPRQINTYKTIYDLPSEVLVLSFMFLGIGHFRFIGGTSRTFRELYLYMCCRGETGTGTGTGTWTCVPHNVIFWGIFGNIGEHLGNIWGTFGGRCNFFTT